MLGSATLDESEIDTWRIRLGHFNTLDLQEAVRNNLLSGLPAVVGKNNKRKKALCHPCILSKSTKNVRHKRPRHSYLSQSAVTSSVSDDTCHLIVLMQKNLPNL